MGSASARLDACSRSTVSVGLDWLTVHNPVARSSTRCRASSKLRISGFSGAAAMQQMIRAREENFESSTGDFLVRLEKIQSTARQFLPQHAGVAGVQQSSFEVHNP